MKSKITLLVLIVVIVFLASLSFFFGYKYLNSNDKINELTAQVEELSKNQDETLEQEDVQESQTQVTEKLTIPQVNLDKLEKLDSDNIVGYKLTSEYIRESDNLSYILGTGTTYTPMSVENYDYQFLYRGKGYTFGDKGIVEVKHQYMGATEGYYILLFDDGTVSYALASTVSEDPTLTFIDTGLKDVVKLSTIGIEYQNGRIAPFVCAITNDGVTHIITYQ